MPKPVTKNCDWRDIRDWGAVDDGSDTTAAIQHCLDDSEGHTVVVPEGDWFISAPADDVASLKLRNHQTLWLEPGASLRMLPNGFEKYRMVEIHGVTGSGVTGRSGEIVGDLPGHTGTSGQWGMGIDFYDCFNCFATDVKISHCWGDGIRVGNLWGDDNTDIRNPATNTLIENVHVYENRRLGVSVVNAQSLNITNCTFERTGRVGPTTGASPTSGINIESQTDDIVLHDIIVDSCISRDNLSAGFIVSASTRPERTKGIRLSNCVSSNNNTGYILGGGYAVFDGIDSVENSVRGIWVLADTANTFVRLGQVFRNQSGIVLQGTSGMVFEGGKVAENVNDGIFASDADNTIIKGVHIENNGRYGVNAQANNQGLKLLHNSFHDDIGNTHLFIGTSNDVSRFGNCYEGGLINPNAYSVPTKYHDFEFGALVSNL